MPPPLKRQVHARNKVFDNDIDLKEIALRTPGFSGALRRLFSSAGAGGVPPAVG